MNATFSLILRSVFKDVADFYGNQQHCTLKEWWQLCVKMVFVWVIFLHKCRERGRWFFYANNRWLQIHCTGWMWPSKYTRLHVKRTMRRNRKMVLTAWCQALFILYETVSHLCMGFLPFHLSRTIDFLFSPSVAFSWCTFVKISRLRIPTWTC